MVVGHCLTISPGWRGCCFSCASVWLYIRTVDVNGVAHLLLPVLKGLQAMSTAVLLGMMEWNAALPGAWSASCGCQGVFAGQGKLCF